MATGPAEVEGTWYVFSSSGSLSNGWVRKDGEWYYGKDSEGTIDCDHGSDLGYDRMISERLPRIRKILRKYGIR